VANLYGRLIGDQARNEATRIARNVIYTSLETWGEKLLLNLDANGKWMLWRANKNAAVAPNGAPAATPDGNTVLLADGVLQCTHPRRCQP